MTIVPLTLKEARVFVARHHRHHRAPQGGLFAIGCARNGEVVGVAIVGRPVARGNQDGFTAEVTRLCVMDGQKNACSMLYAAAWRGSQSDGLYPPHHLHPAKRERHVIEGGGLAPDRAARRRIVVVQEPAARRYAPAGAEATMGGSMTSDECPKCGGDGIRRTKDGWRCVWCEHEWKAAVTQAGGE